MGRKEGAMGLTPTAHRKQQEKGLSTTNGARIIRVPLVSSEELGVSHTDTGADTRKVRSPEPV